MSEPRSGDERVNAVIADYLRNRATGNAPDRAMLIAAHPEFADDLKSFFSDHDRMHRFVEPATVGPNEPEAFETGITVRYFGDYELLEELARGGMGVVYKARQISLNRLVALKMILAGQLASATDVQRFRAEAEAAANLDHPNIVPIHEVGEHQGQQYFSMKLVEGGSLAELLKERHLTADEHRLNLRQSAKSAVQVLTSVTRAVHYAHQRGILHRDLKPGNILLDTNNQPLVTDFGLAKRVEGDSKQTQTGAILGTPSYMAPEQARAEKQLSTAADVYSLGAILYECLTGRPPFQAATTIETVMQVLEQEPTRPGAIDPQVDRDLETIALKCLEKEPGKRYESAAALADELDRWQRGEPIQAKPISTSARAWKWAKRRPALAALVGVSGVALAALIAIVLAYNSRLTTELGNVTEQRNIATEQQRIAAERERTTSRYWYAADMALAQQALQNEQVPRLLDLLNRHRPAEGEADPRGFEWHYLWRLCHGEESSWRRAEKSNRIDLVADGHFALASSIRGYEIVDITSRAARLLGEKEFPIGWNRRLNEPGKWDLFTATYAPDVKEPTSVTIRSCDLATGRDLTTLELPLPAGKTRSFVPSPDGTVLVIVENPFLTNIKSIGIDSTTKKPKFAPFAPMYEGFIRFRDLSSGQESSHHVSGFMPQNLGPTMTCAFSPDGQRFALVGVEGPANTAGAMATLVFNPASATVVKINVLLIDRKSGQVLRLKNKPDAFVFAMEFSPDGSVLATADEDGAIRLWNPITGELRETLRGPRGPVVALAFSADGQSLVTGGNDQVVRLWDIRTGNLRASFLGHPAGVTGVRLLSDGATIVSADSDGWIKKWNSAKRPGMIQIGVPKAEKVPGLRSATRMQESMGAHVERMIFSDDSQSLLLGIIGRDQLSAVRANDGGLAERTPYPAGEVVAWTRGPDGLRIVLNRRKGSSVEWIYWDAAAKKEVSIRRPTGEAVVWNELSPNGRLVAGRHFTSGKSAADIKGEAVIFDLTNGVTMPAIPTNYDSAVFSPDSSRLVTSGEHKICVWNVATSELIQTVTEEAASRTNVCWLPNRERLMYANKDGDLVDFDLAEKKVVRTTPGLGTVNQLVFSPDGRRVIVASAVRTGSSTIKIFDLEGLELQTLASWQGNVKRLVISPDGRKLAAVVLKTILGSPEICIWDTSDPMRTPANVETATGN
ncbi:MAG: protein kinase domain-containing protein [Gemmataceae bacterium]